MIIQTAPAGAPRLAIMMHEHTALAHQFARVFGNDAFAPPEPAELMFHVVLHHDAGWFAFDRDPKTDPRTGLPYNLVDTPIRDITVTSRGSPDYNERHHPFCGLISSMHSFGLYNGRYGISDMVLIDKIPAEDKQVAQRLLDGELARQARLKAALAADATTAGWVEEAKLFASYKQLQFFDTLALYFNRVHPSERVEARFTHVPVNAKEDVTVTVRPVQEGAYALSPYPFAAEGAEFAYAGRRISAGEGGGRGGWDTALRRAATVWETVRLLAG
jgi:Protein of unknown function (DUF3891)